MKYDYEKLGASIGALVTEKQKAYGDSFHKSGKVMEQLFPNGIPPNSYVDALAIVRIIDKLFRIATDPDYGGESPWGDINGYSLLRLADKESKYKVEKEYRPTITQPPIKEVFKDSFFKDDSKQLLKDLDEEIEKSIPSSWGGSKYIPTTIDIGGDNTRYR